MTDSSRKHCQVVYATPERQLVWTVELPAEATIADALAAARQQAAPPDVPWDEAPVGIFGEVRDRSYCPQHADRIEIYRPLRADPRQRRREAVQRLRKSSSR
jgi:putative ubiquitin-RnfH superfamily antitoxin RatB of RatAB toxin-antitoxin module